MTKLAPEWVRTSDPVIRSPARYRWTTAPALKHVLKGHLSITDKCPYIAGSSTLKYKLLNKRNPYLTSVAYYLDFGNYNPHYLVPNCSVINLESNDGNHKRSFNYPRYQSRTSTGGSLAKSGSFSTSMVTIRNNFCAHFGGGIMVWGGITAHGKIW